MKRLPLLIGLIVFAPAFAPRATAEFAPWTFTTSGGFSVQLPGIGLVRLQEGMLPNMAASFEGSGTAVYDVGVGSGGLNGFSKTGIYGLAGSARVSGDPAAAGGGIQLPCRRPGRRPGL